MKKVLPIIIALVVLLSACSTPSSNNWTAGTAQDSKKAEVVYIMAGKVEAGEKSDIASKIPAKILELSVDIGTVINKGDPIVRLDTRDLEAQVGQAQAAVNSARANLNKVLAGARPEQIAEAQASLESSVSSYENAKKNYERNKALQQQGALSQQQYEASEQQYEVAQAQYVSAKERLETLKKGETKETIAVYQSQVNQAQAALELAQTQLSNGIIYAPITGVVSAKNLNVGELATAGVPVVTIVNAATININAYLPASLSDKVKEGQAVTVKISELSGKQYEGHVTTVDPVIDSKSKNILVKVKLDNPDSQLKPGMFAEIGMKM